MEFTKELFKKNQEEICNRLYKFSIRLLELENNNIISMEEFLKNLSFKEYIYNNDDIIDMYFYQYEVFGERSIILKLHAKTNEIEIHFNKYDKETEKEQEIEDYYANNIF